MKRTTGEIYVCIKTDNEHKLDKDWRRYKIENKVFQIIDKGVTFSAPIEKGSASIDFYGIKIRLFIKTEPGTVLSKTDPAYETLTWLYRDEHCDYLISMGEIHHLKRSGSCEW